MYDVIRPCNTNYSRKLALPQELFIVNASNKCQVFRTLSRLRVEKCKIHPHNRSTTVVLLNPVISNIFVASNSHYSMKFIGGCHWLFLMRIIIMQIKLNRLKNNFRLICVSKIQTISKQSHRATEPQIHMCTKHYVSQLNGDFGAVALKRSSKTIKQIWSLCILDAQPNMGTWNMKHRTWGQVKIVE